MKKLKNGLGIIGMGKMGEAVARGLARGSVKPAWRVAGTTHTAASARQAQKALRIPCSVDNRRLARERSTLLLCVKPHQAKLVLEEIQGELTARHLVISICAGVTTTQLDEWSGGRAAIVRAMPNTPCLIGEGMTVVCGGPRASERSLREAERIFAAVGRTAAVGDEELMDGVTGLSGCGPAYIYLIIEALSEAGVKVGLSRETATLLAAQTLLGAGRMVRDLGAHPAALKDEVTTPAGCTIDGLMALEDGGLRSTLIKAVVAATARSRTLAKAT